MSAFIVYAIADAGAFTPISKDVSFSFNSRDFGGAGIVTGAYAKRSAAHEPVDYGGDFTVYAISDAGGFTPISKDVSFSFNSRNFGGAGIVTGAYARRFARSFFRFLWYVESVGGLLITLDAGTFLWTVDGVSEVVWTPPGEPDVEWTVDGAAACEWFGIGLWRVDGRAQCTWGHDKAGWWNANCRAACEWYTEPPVTAAWRADGQGGLIWLLPPGGVSEDCITGDGELPEGGGVPQNYVF